MILAKNYEKLSKFVKVTAKILSAIFFQYVIANRTELSNSPLKKSVQISSD